ncbi:MAG: hypothetical protein LYZ70_05940 [Nitrososphaerales archaeon]|nr:hypothetical protein [Nitrososphaerales archaeon]
MQATQGKWAARFIWASVIQGLLATIVTLLIIDPTTLFNGSGLYYSASRVIAGSGGGTWMFTGYITYLVVGVVAMAVTAIFYFYIEGVQGKVYRGLSSYLAWGHLILMNVGVVGSMFLMMRGGYLAGWAAAATSAGGGGLTPAQIHEQILGWLPVPIGSFIVLAALGALLGGLGFIIRSRMK